MHKKTTNKTWKQKWQQKNPTFSHKICNVKPESFNGKSCSIKTKNKRKKGCSTSVQNINEPQTHISISNRGNQEILKWYLKKKEKKGWWQVNVYFCTQASVCQAQNTCEAACTVEHCSDCGKPWQRERSLTGSRDSSRVLM